MGTRWTPVLILAALAACSGGSSRGDLVAPPPGPPERPVIAASLPRQPGNFAPSMMALGGDPGADGTTMTGDLLSDVDTCSTCHVDIADQWGASAHSFASFNNPIYRVNVELARHDLGKPQSQHCGGCHDASLQIDGLMLAEIPPDDLRSHSGVTCRLCHGVDQVTSDGNGSYVLARAPIGTPDLDDPASIASHKAQATVKPLGDELCVGCHRGFLSPDVDVPVHVSGIDEPTFWRSSAYTGSGVGRIDKVEKKGCIDCHMATEAAGPDEVAAHDGVVASHRFVGGHSWMAGMRGDEDQLARTRKMLEGVASIDVAGAIVEESVGGGIATAAGRFYLPADGAPVVAGTRIALDVVVRNLLVGHRFPGGVMDVQDTWIELEVTDARGARIASSGLGHETDVDDEDTHVLRVYVVNERGELLEEHELPSFRGPIANHTIAARDAIGVRYTFEVPEVLVAAQLPLEVEARLRHRSRTLRFQREVCDTARTAAGKAFIEGTKAARDADLDPCKPQPVTEIARTTIELGAGATPTTARPAWERMYEHGMALVPVITERLDEPRVILEAALAAVPAGDAKARATVLVQLGSVAGKQGRTHDAIALLEEARSLLTAPYPPVIDFLAADALSRVWRWEEAARYAAAAVERAPLNTAAWVMLARARGSLHDDPGALEAARGGLAISPRNPDLLRSQATALRSLDPDLAEQALDKFDRFRSPDAAPQLRMTCAGKSARCAREREMGHTHVMKQSR